MVITGAWAGIGRAVINQFFKAGYDKALLSHDPERLERTADETRQPGVRAPPIPTGVSDAAAIATAVDKVEAELVLSTLVDLPTVQAIWANRIAPAFAYCYIAKHGYSAQTMNQPLSADYKGNL